MKAAVREAEACGWQVSKSLPTFARNGGRLSTRKGSVKERRVEAVDTKLHDMPSLEVWQTLPFRKVLSAGGGPRKCRPTHACRQ